MRISDWSSDVCSSDLLDKAEPRKPKGLVLVPTRELALQVHDVLAPLAKAIGSRVVAVYGGADMNKQIAALADGVEAHIAPHGRLIDLIEHQEVEPNRSEASRVWKG